jgi:hypothetical protein
VLSVGVGWIKVVMLSNKDTDPEVANQLRDAQDNIEKLRLAQAELAEGAVDDTEVKVKEMERLAAGLEANLEVVVSRFLAIDFCAAEDVQMSLDVHDMDDYLAAGWMSNAIYKPKSELRAMFPRLTEDQVKEATCYYQKRPDDYSALLDQYGSRIVSDDDAEQFTRSDKGGAGPDEDTVEFGRIVEIWDHRDNMIKTTIEGVKCWPKEPFAPQFATLRFYPYFQLAFFEVDGARHPQSLSWRLAKLQDEYSRSR